MPRARRMMRRRRIARTAASAAVVGGTAAAVGGVVRHHQNKKYAQQAYDDQMDQEQYADPVEQAPVPDLTAQLQQLAQLHDSGVLTDEEFATAKQKVLAGE